MLFNYGVMGSWRRWIQGLGGLLLLGLSRMGGHLGINRQKENTGKVALCGTSLVGVYHRVYLKVCHEVYQIEIEARLSLRTLQ
jgi:hypothetical protein